jgi:hypothetical protein
LPFLPISRSRRSSCLAGFSTLHKLIRDTDLMSTRKGTKSGSQSPVWGRERAIEPRRYDFEPGMSDGNFCTWFHTGMTVVTFRPSDILLLRRIRLSAKVGVSWASLRHSVLRGPKSSCNRFSDRSESVKPCLAQFKLALSGKHSFGIGRNDRGADGDDHSESPLQSGGHDVLA